MTKTYDGSDQTTYTLNSGRDDEFVELFDGSSKYMELREKIIELECEVASRDKEISKNDDYEEKMDKYLDYTTNGAISKSVATPIGVMKQEHDSNIERLIDENKSCDWEQTDEYEGGFIYHTDCKMDWVIMDSSTPKENGMKYCPRCGGKIKIKGEKEDGLK